MMVVLETNSFRFLKPARITHTSGNTASRTTRQHRKIMNPYPAFTEGECRSYSRITPVCSGFFIFIPLLSVPVGFLAVEV